MELSIGMEFEAVVGPTLNTPAGKNPTLKDVVKLINESGPKAALYLPTSLRTVPDFTVWNVTTDATINEVTSGSDSSESAMRNRSGVEITTPTYVLATTDWESEVRVVLGYLQNAFSERKLVWKANRSTGLHVHVGRVSIGDGVSQSTFSLDETRRIVKVVVKFEDIIDTLHASHRSVTIQNDNIESNRHNPLLHPLSIKEIFSLLDSCATVEDIIRTVNHAGDTVTYDGYADSKFFKVNFTSLMKYGTIEFRQHAGTVDSATTIRWAKTVLNIVWYAVKANDGEIEDLEATKEGLEKIISSANNA